jgi:DNA-directed RNA polymerase subunit H
MTKDVLKHELVPEHIIVADNDEKLLKNLKCDEKQLPEKIKKQLPKIKVTDPVVEAIGASESDILQITRKSQTAGTFIYYRIVKS